MKDHIENKIKEITASIQREKQCIKSSQDYTKSCEERLAKLELDLQIHSDALVKEITKYVPKFGEPPFSTPPEPREAPRNTLPRNFVPDSLKPTSLKSNVFDSGVGHIENEGDTSPVMPSN